jgi:hypothetical protein
MKFNLISRFVLDKIDREKMIKEENNKKQKETNIFFNDFFIFNLL